MWGALGHVRCPLGHVNQFDHSIFVSNVTFQMGINTGEVEIAGLSDKKTESSDGGEEFQGRRDGE